MKHTFFSRNTTFAFLLLLICPLFIGKVSAQRDPNNISSRHYVGAELGVNYSWLPGAQNYYIGFNWPYTDASDITIPMKFSMPNLGGGLGFHIAATLDLSLTDFFGFQGKLFYRTQNTSHTENDTGACTGGTGIPGTATFENRLSINLGYFGLGAALRLQFQPNGIYGLIGFDYSALLSNSVTIHQRIVSSDNNCQYLILPSQTQSGSTQFDVTNAVPNYFNTSQIAAKLGIGTFFELGTSHWVLCPELTLGIPLSKFFNDATETGYSNASVTTPKLWHATFSVALKFPFGAMSKADMESTSYTTSSSNQKYANLKGKVTDAKSGKPVQANVTVTDLNSNEVVTTTKTDDDGEYDVRVKAPGRYSVTADADGYLFGSALYEVDDDGRILSGKHDIKLDQATGRTRLLIFFDFDKAELQRSSYPELDRVVHLMKANKNMEVEIAGYTDSKGTDAYNNDLSLRRANAVRSYLLKNGIADNRIAAKGYGKDSPIAPNDTEDGRAENRRVEFVVLHK